MANPSLPVLCILLAIGHFSVGNLVLDVRPDIITPGVTSDLIVNCSVTYSYQSGISNIISLVISKAESRINQTGLFSDVISINAFTNQVIGKDNTNRAITSGNIDSNTLDAFLSLSWSSPSQAESGFYRCDANFLDDFGHPVDISTSAEVTSSKLDLVGLTKIVETLRADLESAKSELDVRIQTNNALTSTIAAQNSTIAAKTSKIIELEEQLKKNSETNDFQAMPDQLVSLLSIKKNQSYNGHSYYLLSEISLGNIDLAEYFCSKHQGYLVEVEDEQERQFLVKFLDSESMPWLLLGATQGAQSGQWVYRHSGRPVTLLGRVSGRNSDNGGDCPVQILTIAVYDSNITAFMYDVSGTCFNALGFRLVCEVPES